MFLFRDLTANMYIHSIKFAPKKTT